MVLDLLKLDKIPHQINFSEKKKFSKNGHLKTLKHISNCCKLDIAFKCQARLYSSFRSKNPIPKDLKFGVLYEVQCGFSN